MKRKVKTVYVLGAGFSIEAKAPSQERIVEKIFEVFESRENLLLPANRIAEFEEFLSITLGIPKELHKTIPLEDIFTPIDRCISDNVAFRNLSVDQLRAKRQLVIELIGKTLAHLLQNAQQGYINHFAKHVVNEARRRQLDTSNDIDSVAVISTNWDILLDNAIYQELNHNQANLEVVDYCCYISSFDENDNSVKPGLYALAKGGVNVKLLKLHGSLNWLQCPRCQRLYAKFNRKIAVDSDIPNCRHCDENFEPEHSHKLVHNLIMPTFLKDLSNPQYKIIWQNAGIELSEAKKIVFIGYSLPQADFEMRQLLSRMVANGTEIEVVDYEGDNDVSKAAYGQLIQNYKQFFGNPIIKGFEKGAKDYVENHLIPAYHG